MWVLWFRQRWTFVWQVKLGLNCTQGFFLLWSWQLFLSIVAALLVLRCEPLVQKSVVVVLMQTLYIHERKVIQGTRLEWLHIQSQHAKYMVWPLTPPLLICFWLSWQSHFSIGCFHCVLNDCGVNKCCEVGLAIKTPALTWADGDQSPWKDNNLCSTFAFYSCLFPSSLPNKNSHVDTLPKWKESEYENLWVIKCYSACFSNIVYQWCTLL